MFCAWLLKGNQGQSQYDDSANLDKSDAGKHWLAEVHELEPVTMTKDKDIWLSSSRKFVVNLL